MINFIFTAKECINKIKRVLSNNVENLSIATSTQNRDSSGYKIKCSVLYAQDFHDFQRKWKVFKGSLDIGLIKVSLTNKLCILTELFGSGN